MTTEPDDLYEHKGDDPEHQTRCRACGRQIGNFYAARVAPGRAHVRKEQAFEGQAGRGHIAFSLPGERK